jgi:uncharacterized Fe-S center protein
MTDMDVTLIPCNTIPYSSPLALLKREIANYISSWEMAGQPVAIKVHFGEAGAVRFLRPIYVKPAAEAVKAVGGYPFLTDTNTLYKGPRALSPTHLQTAMQHGFSYGTVNCPTIIADGVFSTNEVEVTENGKSFFLAGDLANTQYHIVLTHVTLHGFTGLGSSVKNIGMGYATKKGKTDMHMETVPEVSRDLCAACGKCIQRCDFNALSLKNKKISLDKTRCTGCCHCIGVCIQNVYDVKETALKRFSQRLGEYTKAAITGKKMIFVNFLMDITRQCDCASFTHKPVCEDIGILISDNILAVEGAAMNLLNRYTKLGKEVTALWEAQFAAFSDNLDFVKNIRIKEVKK